MRVEIEVKGLPKDSVSVDFECHYLPDGSKTFQAKTDDGVTWYADVPGGPYDIRPHIMCTTVTIDPDSTSTVTFVQE